MLAQNLELVLKKKMVARRLLADFEPILKCPTKNPLLLF